MVRRANDQWKARIKYVSALDAVQRYAEVIRILAHTKKRMNLADAEIRATADSSNLDGDSDAT